MYWNPQVRCVVCKKIIGGDNKLQRRLNVCSRFVKGGEPWTRIATEYGFNKISLSVHLKKHQNPAEKAGALAVSDAIQAEAVKERRKAIDVTHEMLDAAFDDKGEIREDIKMKITPNTIVQLNKQNFEQEKHKEKKNWVQMLLYGYIAEARKLKEEVNDELITGSTEGIPGEDQERV